MSVEKVSLYLTLSTPGLVSIQLPLLRLLELEFRSLTETDFITIGL